MANRPIFGQNFNYYVTRNLIFYSKLFLHLAKNPGEFKFLFAQKNIPWITFGATHWLEENLDKTKKVLEFGAGRSTIYFSRKAGQVESIESSEHWYKLVTGAVNTFGRGNCRVALCESPADYARIIERFDDNSFDLVLIDGIERNECVRASRSKVRLGGAIILDNSERTEYSAGIELLSSWHRLDFYSPGPNNKYFWQTSVFIKP